MSKFDDRDQLPDMNDNFEIGGVDVYQLFYDYYISKIATLKISESELDEFITEIQKEIYNSRRDLEYHWSSLVRLKKEIQEMDIFESNAQKNKYLKGFLNDGAKNLQIAIGLDKKIAETDRVTNQEKLELLKSAELRTNLKELLEKYKNPRNKDEMLSIYKKMSENNKSSINLFKKYSELRNDESLYSFQFGIKPIYKQSKEHSPVHFKMYIQTIDENFKTRYPLFPSFYIVSEHLSSILDQLRIFDFIEKGNPFDQGFTSVQWTTTSFKYLFKCILSYWHS